MAYRYWHDLRYPGSVARAIVEAQRAGRRPPRAPERCADERCAVCHPDGAR